MKVKNPRKKNPTTAAPSVGSRLIVGLTELRDVLAGGEPVEKHFKVRTRTILPPPTPHDARSVLATREKLGASPAVFAQLVGVSTVQAQSWEQGLRKPPKVACRLLDEINRDPSHWRQMIGAA